LVCSSSMEVCETDTETLERVGASHDRMRSMFARRFSRAVREGELPSDTDVESLAGFVVSSNMGMQVTARTQPGVAVLRGIADRILESIPTG
ncbi:MAG: hypothetical protein KDA24_22040, partial [Deltaproteobacteria bacterium]|nr:hypothetical protein [Deltaproteobacteria bacterium]